MNPFAAIEEACATLVERTFARVFPNDVAPAQIARKLVATMQSSPAETYLVRLHPRDIAGLGDERAALESEWGEVLIRTAATLDLPLTRPARVVVHEDEETVPGTVTIEALVDDEEAASARGYALRITKGLPLDAAFPVDGPVTIGRGPENTVDLVDLRVSRKHARLSRTPDGVVVEDLGSTNGTQVNGERVAGRARVVAGDVIGVGDTELRLEVGGD